MRKRVLLGFVVLLLAGPVFVQAGDGVWTSSGPTGGSVQEFVVDPTDPATVYAAGGSGGLFKSTDAGVSWTALIVAPYTPFLSYIRMSPHDPDVLLVSSGPRLYRSLDAGTHWSPLGGGLPVSDSIYDLTFDPHVVGRVFVVDASGLWQSLDNGTTWTSLAGSGLSGSPLEISADPHVSGRLFALGADPVSNEETLYRSVDAGLNWTPATGLPTYVYRKTLSFSSTAGTLLVAAPGDVVFRSTDGGASFASLGETGLPNARSIRTIHHHPADPNTWWIGTETGLMRTTNGGASYSVVGQGIRPSAGGSYDNGVSAFWVDPTAPSTWYAGALYTGFYVTTDAGVSWSRRNDGLRQASIRALAVHPNQPQWVYAGYGDAFSTPSDGLFRSIDRGASWFTASPTLEASGLRGLTIDGNTDANPFTTTLYAAGYGSPLYSLSGAIRDGNAGIYKSVDGGATWATIDAGIPFHTDFGHRESWFSIARTVVLDPSSGGPPGGTGPLQTAYLGGSGRIQYDPVTGTPNVRAARIYKSTDAGANWTAADTGLPIPTYDTVTHTVYAVQVVPIAIDPVTPTTLYAGTFTTAYLPPSSNPLVSQGVINGVFKSTDGGANWTHSSNGLPRMNPSDPDSAIRSVLALALAPSQPNRLYVAVHNDVGDSRIYVSSDGAATWTEANNGIAPDADIRVLIVDPTDADTAYAGSTGSESNPGGVYRTTDGGANWTSYSIGLPSSAALALALDQSGVVPRLYAGTRDGVFEIDQVPDEDADGAPTALEAGAPNGGDGNGDGIPDTVQPGVASLTAMGDMLRGGADYISIELVPVEGACAQLENTHALSASTFPLDPGYDYPFGLVRMDLSDCTQAELKLTYHGGSFDGAWRFRTYAPLTPDQVYTYAWHDLPFTRDGNTWSIVLTDNLLGDLRAGENAILFQGGVTFGESIFENGFELE